MSGTDAPIVNMDCAVLEQAYSYSCPSHTAVADPEEPIDLSTHDKSVPSASSTRGNDSVVVLDDTLPDVLQHDDSSIVDLISDDDVVITAVKQRTRRTTRRPARQPPPDDDAPLVAVSTTRHPLDDDVIVIEKENSKRKITSDTQAECDSTPKRKMLTCPVCFDHERTIRREGKHWMSTKCGHIFCNECIILSINSTKCCPMCKVKLNKKTGIHPLFIGE